MKQHLLHYLLPLLAALYLAAAPVAAEDDEPAAPATVIADGELEQLLAPVALYPDTLLSHILIAATYPFEVVQAARWSDDHPDLAGQEAVDAVEDRPWDPSVKALVAFPELLQRMSDDLDWLQRLGEAFLVDESRVLAAVQTLRERAQTAGSLDDLEYAEVRREEKVIVIEPAVREVVYLPYYDTRVVYGDWRWHHYPPVYWVHPHHTRWYHDGPHFYWSSAVHLGPGFYFSSFHWHNRHVVVVDVHHHAPRRYYTHRELVHHDHSRRWHHDPDHRRRVVYRDQRLQRDYGRHDDWRHRGEHDRVIDFRRRDDTAKRYTNDFRRDREWHDDRRQRDEVRDPRVDHALPGRVKRDEEYRRSLLEANVHPLPGRNSRGVEQPRSDRHRQRNEVRDPPVDQPLPGRILRNDGAERVPKRDFSNPGGRLQRGPERAQHRSPPARNYGGDRQRANGGSRLQR